MLLQTASSETKPGYTPGSLGALTVGALGVVYGDIGTSSR
jgi:K+ transporter